MKDEDRFHDCLPLKGFCQGCHQEISIPSVIELQVGMMALTCSQCGAAYYGRK
jgi:transcription elongation factor Elf1